MEKINTDKIAKEILDKANINIHVNYISYCGFCMRKLSKRSVLEKVLVNDKNSIYCGCKGLKAIFGHLSCVNKYYDNH